MLKAAIIGLGTVAPVHLDAIAQNQNINLVGVCDILPDRASIAPRGTPFFTDYSEMIKNTAPDVVHICLPHHLHFPVAVDAMEMGANVFCEKPMAINSQEGALFLDMVLQYPKLKVGICLQNRVNETVQKLKSIIDSGRYGQVTGANGVVLWQRSQEYYEAKPWRGCLKTAGGGCMINQAIHTLDLLTYLGGKIERVKATVAQLLDYGIEVEDTVAANLDYANGGRALFIATLANFRSENVRISLELEKANFTILDNTLYQIDEDGVKEKLIQDAKMPGTKYYYGASHGKLINQFYEAVELDNNNYFSVADSLLSLQLIDAIEKSSLTGQAVVL